MTPTDSPLSDESWTGIALGLTGAIVVGFRAWGSSSDAARDLDARDEAAALGTVLRQHGAWGTLFGDLHLGAGREARGEGPVALYPMTPQTLGTVALERNLSAGICEIKARAFAASSRRDGAACVPEAGEDGLWQSLAARTTG